MRSPIVLLLPFLLLPIAIACSAPTNEEEQGSDTSNLTGSSSCSLSRAKILGSTSAARRQAIERGFEWLDANVPYSQAKTHEGYRTDCSGFVSMCWDSGKPGSNTSAMFGGTKVANLSSFNDLVPADALVRKGHVVLFLGWNDAAKTGACVIEQSSTANDMQFRVRTAASLKSSGYKAIRADKFAGDTTLTEGAGSGETGSATTGGEDPPKRTDAGGGGACVPESAAVLCEDAFQLRGVECGTISDGCGGKVNCDTVELFGCEPGATCGADNLCAGPACPVKTAVDLCNEAKAKDGVQCGVIPDGCGATVNCDEVTSFGCGAEDTCVAATNRCAKSTSGAKPPEAPASPPQAGVPTPLPSPEGDQQDGDVGDEKDPTEKATLPTKSTDSGGCSASSSSQGPAKNTSLPFVALAMAALAVLRSRRAATNAKR